MGGFYAQVEFFKCGHFGILLARACWIASVRLPGLNVGGILDFQGFLKSWNFQSL